MSDSGTVEVGEQHVGLIIGCNQEHRLVLMRFQYPMLQVPMPADMARSVATELNRWADQVDPPMVVLAEPEMIR